MRTYQIAECCGLCRYWDVGKLHDMLPRCSSNNSVRLYEGQPRENSCTHFEPYIPFEKLEICRPFNEEKIKLDYLRDQIKDNMNNSPLDIPINLKINISVES